MHYFNKYIFMPQYHHTRTIMVPAGIGDNIWIAQKLIAAKERFNFRIPDGKPQRTKPLFDLLPQIAESSEYIAGLKFGNVQQAAQANAENFCDIKDKVFALECNTHLEAGKRIEDFLP